MPDCLNCDQPFDPETARAEWAEYGADYGKGEEFSQDVCSDCQLPELASLRDQGNAILMMNGEFPYDEEFEP